MIYIDVPVKHLVDEQKVICKPSSDDVLQFVFEPVLVNLCIRLVVESTLVKPFPRMLSQLDVRILEMWRLRRGVEFKRRERLAQVI